MYGMLLFKVIICVQVLLYLLFGAILFFPMKLLEINNVSNHGALIEGNKTAITEEIELTQPTQVGVVHQKPSSETISTIETPPTTCLTMICGICKNETNNTGGIIASPNYPTDYGNDRTCIYTIRVPAARKIQLSFTVFNVEDTFDWIDVYDVVNPIISNNITMGSSLTGYDLPKTRNSSSNVMTIRFMSDLDNSHLPDGMIGRWQGVYKVI